MSEVRGPNDKQMMLMNMNILGSLSSPPPTPFLGRSMRRVQRREDGGVLNHTSIGRRRGKESCRGKKLRLVVWLSPNMPVLTESNGLRRKIIIYQVLCGHFEYNKPIFYEIKCLVTIHIYFKLSR